jgi:molybdopterin/thiamine biosynthesis adenylyltransferase
MEEDIYSRIRDILDVPLLASRTIAVVGLGSLGSMAVLELAKCGAGRFRLVDFDRLSSHNIPRHACGLKDVGRLKVEAVRDLIVDRNPQASVETYPVDVMADWDKTASLIKGSDIALVATDYDRPRRLVNQILVDLWFNEHIAVPMILGGVYEKGFGGEVFRIVPGETACYDCIRMSLDREGIGDEPRKAGAGDYTDDLTKDGSPQPGMGIDVGFVALIQAKMALATLLRGRRGETSDIDSNAIIWGNRPHPHLFERPLTCLYCHIARREDCLTCSSQVE